MLTKTYKLEKKDNLYDLIQSIDSYRALRNPTTTKHRFIVEDTMSGSGASGLRGSLSRHCHADDGLLREPRQRHLRS